MAIALEGTVTFLFSDIEGSTRILEALGPNRYREVLEAHNAIFRGAAAANEVSTEGDSFFCAFASAIEAVNSALAIQRGLAKHPWPEGAEVRVRMGLHTGEAVRGGDNYVGLAVHRAARIASAAHGGQILLSEASAALVREALPGEASLRDLGWFRLKDLAHPEQLFQVDASGLQSEFPVPTGEDSGPARLPEQLTTFVGREEEIASVLEAITDARLVTLSGIGGSGKTRVAIQCGHRASARFPGGVFFIPLDEASDESAVAKILASSLSVQEQVGTAIEETVIEFIAPREVLLIFDNCEHVTGEAARLAALLLRSCRGLKILATSRESLLVPGEHLFELGPMNFPEDSTVSTIDSDAVRLFVERASYASPGFEPGRWLDQCVEICRRLEGIPLAIELAAARTSVLDPDEILARLDNRFALLRTRGRGVDPRHGTLVGAIDWSYDLLDSRLQRLLRHLSVFRGGFTLAAVGAICFEEPPDEHDILDMLTELNEKSLLPRTSHATGSRFRLLETIREYAAMRLHDEGEDAAAHRRHRAFYTSLASAKSHELGGPGQMEALDHMEAEHPNFLAVIQRADDEGDLHAAAEMASWLTWFWYVHSHFSTGEKWAHALLDSIPEQADRTWLRLVLGAGLYDFRLGNFHRSEIRLQKALRLATDMGLPRLQMWSHAYLATNDLYRLHLEEALGHADQALELAGGLGDALGLGYATYIKVSTRSATLYRSEDLDPSAAADLAARLEPVSLSVRAIGERNMIGHVLQSQGFLHARAGDLPQATAALDQSIQALTELGQVGCACHCLEAIADLLSLKGDAATATALIAAAGQLRGRIGISIAPVEDEFINAARARCENALGAAGVGSHSAEGALLSLPEATQLAREALARL